MAININYNKKNGFMDKHPYDFRINYPFLWREVNKTLHTFVQYAQLDDKNDENKTLLLPHRMWTTRPADPLTLLEGEEVQYIWDYTAAWNLNNISYLNK
jgi:hypothetical protein